VGRGWGEGAAYRSNQPPVRLRSSAHLIILCSSVSGSWARPAQPPVPWACGSISGRLGMVPWHCSVVYVPLELLHVFRRGGSRWAGMPGTNHPQIAASSAVGSVGRVAKTKTLPELRRTVSAKAPTCSAQSAP
jgi:hypothetical protein